MDFEKNEMNIFADDFNVDEILIPNNQQESTAIINNEDQNELKKTDWEIFDSWTLLGDQIITPGVKTKNITKSDLEINPTPSISEEQKTNTENNKLKSDDKRRSRRTTDEEDGISIISENDTFPNLITDDEAPPLTSSTDLHNISLIGSDLSNLMKENTLENQEKSKIKSPINRNSNSSNSNYEYSIRNINLSITNLIIFGILSGIAGIILGQFSQIHTKKDYLIIENASTFVKRISELEKENNFLKEQLHNLRIKSSGINENLKDSENYPQPLDYYVKNSLENGKTIWSGDDHENNDDPQIIPNPKLQIPEFCNHPDMNDDLFSERYLELCDKRKRKLAKLIQKNNYKNQNINSEKDKSKIIVPTIEPLVFERDFIQEKIQVSNPYNNKPMKSEIKIENQEMKNESVNNSGTTNKGKNKFEKERKSFSKKENSPNLNKSKFGNNKKQNEKEWYERRKLGRNEFRVKNAEENLQKNWYMERSMNREKQRFNQDLPRIYKY